ncbi:MAG: IgA Peptidase M64 [Ignavibacteria bacterium]|nr:IgA Peptidase M64 [Ignavibacteria bacterium]
MENKKLILLVFHFFILVSIANSQNINFEDYFLNQTLRIDLIHAGDYNSENYFMEKLIKEPYWGGSKTNLLDKFRYGENIVEVFDFETGKMIYSRGYATLFQEWKATEEAKKIARSFYETIIIPFPKHKIKVVISGRMRKVDFTKMFEVTIDPNDYFIQPAQPPIYRVKKILENGPPEKKVDIVILGEGYTINEIEKLRNDANKIKDYFLNCSPFKEYKENFNFWLIESISEESGTDVPGKGIYKNTILNSSFYTFNIDRYLMTTDIKTVRDLAGYVPYDQIFIIVNTDKYGGGGIYNYYSLTSVDNPYANYVTVHEFGHGFASLADEYYTSEVATEDYYDLKIEPYEPNITTLVDFSSKWLKLVEQDTPIPTPAEDKYKDKVGAFEGGGYVAKGVYRPMIDCTMKSIKYDYFCKICYNAIVEMIKFYSE